MNSERRPRQPFIFIFWINSYQIAPTPEVDQKVGIQLILQRKELLNGFITYKLTNVINSVFRLTIKIKETIISPLIHIIYCLHYKPDIVPELHHLSIETVGNTLQKVIIVPSSGKYRNVKILFDGVLGKLCTLFIIKILFLNINLVQIIFPISINLFAVQIGYVLIRIWLIDELHKMLKL